ncbi:hypothetical protein M406DRAFT_73939 [Cryphonectria parasitica EP155]|uniref:Uncharacterized protein n=1 Tax=Cryphonectria parasitica (strain ATCC 38755 / EP155) TaxID=660469 RepID=A0A9P5CLG6_CRYP1|nr:uncharacterized protein M406DRAFT_73939 [Cryphonectria parasitica EP155]KAF3763324.1 hypothetical protein M406DRAFT_73939 [Cryphonectria parasitica EP155]
MNANGISTIVDNVRTDLGLFLDGRWAEIAAQDDGTFPRESIVRSAVNLAETIVRRSLQYNARIRASGHHELQLELVEIVETAVNTAINRANRSNAVAARPLYSVPREDVTGVLLPFVRNSLSILDFDVRHRRVVTPAEVIAAHAALVVDPIVSAADHVENDDDEAEDDDGDEQDAGNQAAPPNPNAGRLSCPYPRCQTTFAANRLDARRDHLASFHDHYEPGDPKVFSVSEAHLKRAQKHITIARLVRDRTRLNRLKSQLSAAEDRMRALNPNYRATHTLGADRAPQNVDEVALATLTKMELVRLLISARLELQRGWEVEITRLQAEVARLQALRRP